MKRNKFSLKGKVIIITGANGLLGRKHAEAIAAFGGNPLLLDINTDGLDNFCSSLNLKYKSSATFKTVDITDEESVQEASQEIYNQHSFIDGLINNAANNPSVNANGTNFSRLENFSLEQWHKDINVGLTGSFLCSKHFGHSISKNPNGGVIVNISSDLGLIAPDQSLYARHGVPDDKQDVKPITYSVVKTGIIGLTRYLSTYWADKGVRCNALCPGGVENGQPENFIVNVSKKIPLGRLAQPNEYQGVLVWMLSDASSYLNGAIIPVDGGRTAW